MMVGFLLYTKAMTNIGRGYAALGRLSHKVATPFLKLYMSEKHVRVRVLILNEDKVEVLLVRSWLGHQKWTLPGGGIKRAETPAEAAAREVHEETGLRVPLDNLHELGVFPSEMPKYTYTVACYVIEIAKREPRIARHRRLEMLDMAWFPLNALPKDCSPTVEKALALKK
jgi:8-oxo-dGTP pyrophosphatase MutT (NUDIX family)